MCMWRFHSLHQLRRLSEFLPAFTEFSIKLHNHPDRRAEGQHHIMVCDALIWLPFYLVNICPESPYFSEVVYADADKGSQNEAQFVAATFDEFADLLMANPEEAFLSPDLSS